MMQSNRIFIVGHSGAGKGVLARSIAKELAWTFINADVFGCAAHIGRTLVDVVGVESEQSFHHCLTEILSHQMSKNKIVVTTDEIIICDEKARELLKSAFTVYLKVSPSVQVERLSDYRPLLPVENFESFLSKLHDERNSLYEEVASFSLSSDDGNIDAHVKSVINAMG